MDCYVSNFWRAVQADPEAVAFHADWPVNEADLGLRLFHERVFLQPPVFNRHFVDVSQLGRARADTARHPLHARHRWLVDQGAFRERMKRDPDYFDAKIAGWWVWGISQWIGSGWCSRPEWAGRTMAGRTSRGVNSDKWKVRPNLTRTRHLGTSDNWQKRPSLNRGGRGVGSRLPFKMPNLKSRYPIQNNLTDYMFALQDRLRNVRVCCGDWRRILGRSPTTCVGRTAVFLDPPYGEEASRDPSLYNTDDLLVAGDCWDWAVEHGDNPLLRIALCGYEGEHKLPKNWTCLAWKANGGYGNQASGNALRERIWFSPHCLQPQGVLL